MRYDNIFWDWNGTLLDDVSFSIKSINLSLDKRNLPLMTMERYDRTFSFPVINYYKTLGFDLATESYTALANEFIDNYVSFLPHIPLHKNAKPTLERFHKLKVPQYILSASEKNILLDGIARFDLSKYFIDIIALDNVYAKGKIEIGKDWLAANPQKGKTILIGDMPHDYEVATALGMDCALICGGHSTREKLEKLGVPVFDDIKEVFNYILDIPTVQKSYSYKTGKREDVKNYDLTEIKLKHNEKFASSYKDFYDDVKNTPKTEDW